MEEVTGSSPVGSTKKDFTNFREVFFVSSPPSPDPWTNSSKSAKMFGLDPKQFALEGV